LVPWSPVSFRIRSAENTLSNLVLLSGALGPFFNAFRSTLACSSSGDSLLALLYVFPREGANQKVGLTSSVVPVYQSEIAPKNHRGRIVSLQQWAITWGIMIQYFIQYGCSHIDGTASFRLPWGIQMVPAIILFIGLLFFPKSPRWLATKDQWDEARQVLADLHGDGNMSHPMVLAEFMEIEEQIRHEKRTPRAAGLRCANPTSLVASSSVPLFKCGLNCLE